ncbi:MAG: 3-isopropylmalate dehydratase large subunit, partial [Candidatus Margulisiibacteriota bacterium]
AKAGDIVIADLDFMIGQDGTSGVAIDVFNKMGGKNLPAGRQEVFDPKKIAIIIDHSSPSPNEGVSAIHKKIREFAEKYGVFLYDIGCGVCHQITPEQGHVVPGDLVIGADSHTCTYGAINVFSTGIGSTDLAAGMISGKLWFKVPETIQFVVNGKWPKGVYSKDLILKIIGDVRADGATYMASEFVGSAIDELSVDARFTISNMAIEMGAKAGLMRADKKTLEWVKKHSTRTPQPVESDKDAVFSAVKEYDVSKLTPMVAKPHTVDNFAPIEEVEGTEIQQGFIGTCTNGRLEDLEIAASVLKGKKVNKNSRLIVAPASKQIFLDAMKKGLVETIMEAGGVFVTPGCGPCVGTHNGVPSDGEKAISTANRNFKGRMGNTKADIFLASPATVAASVIEGKITDPRRYL